MSGMGVSDGAVKRVLEGLVRLRVPRELRVAEVRLSEATNGVVGETAADLEIKVSGFADGSTQTLGFRFTLDRGPRALAAGLYALAKDLEALR